jgi:diguanylate cyclase (GGDEF)-like protein
MSRSPSRMVIRRRWTALRPLLGYRLQHRPFMLAVILVVLVMCALLVATLASWGGADNQGTIHASAEAVAGFLSATAALAAALRSRGRRAIAWGGWSAYALLLALGSTMLALNAGGSPFPSLQDVIFLGAIPFGTGGALAMMRSTRVSLAGLGIALLDGLLVGASIVVFCLATIFRAYFHTRSNTALVDVVSLAEPATDAVILTIVGAALARTRLMRPAMALICAGVAAITVADFATSFQSLGGTLPPGIPVDLGWTAGILCIGLGALHVLCYRRSADSPGYHQVPRGMSVLFPMAPVVAASGFAITDYIRASLTSDGLMLAATFALAGLMMFRMTIALYMNTRLGKSLEHQATHDALTGLANRVLIRQHLDSRLAKDAASRSGTTLMMLDVDGFKQINDSFGHNIGDLLLVQLAARLQGCVRGADIVGRLGGDEFGIVLHGHSEPAAVARRILDALERPYSIGERHMVVGSSIGIVSGDQEHSADALLRDADLAMYAAKTSGGDQYALYEPRMHTATVGRLQLESDLRADWATEISLSYQPIVDLKSGRMVSVEALARWQHRTRGMVPPDVFIPVAEQIGLMVPMGAKILIESCRQLASWQRDYPEALDLGINVNISGRQLHSDDLIATVTEALLISGIDPSALTLEVTETALVEDMERVIRLLNRVKALDVRIAIDDFGVGTSSLARLRRMPVDVVKIDKSLVDHVPDGHVASALLQSIIGVADALHLRTVLEGVERGDQASHLALAGYDMAQGFYFSRPLTADGIASLLKHGRDAQLGSDQQPSQPWRSGRGAAEVERILIVDDNADLGATVCRIIERDGMQPVLVATRREGIGELQSRRIDGAVIDITLPDGDGWDVIREIRREERLAQIPIVIMTGSLDSAEMLNRAREARCEYLGKPFAAEALLAKLELAKRIAPIPVR